MGIYLCLLIPVLAVLVLYFRFKHKTQWWEFTIPLVVSIIFVFSGKYMAISSLTTDTQYLGGFIKEVRYYEAWNEYIHRTCYRSVKCGKSTCSVPYDCSYVQYHPEHWTAETSLGTINISKSRYNEILKTFGVDKPTFHELNRHFHTQDGDMFAGVWDNSDDRLIPVTVTDSYENRPKASNSIYKFNAVDTADIRHYKLFEYPKINDKNYQQCILGFDDPAAEKKLQILNARLGGEKHVRVFILLFKNLPQKAGRMQERYWEGSNKNEFVITAGINDNNEIQWVYDFSWTEVQETKVETRDFLLAQKQLNLSSVIDFTYKEIQTRWIPRNFHEFDILTIQPSMTAILIIFFLTIAINVGMCMWIVMNEFDDDDSKDVIKWKKRNSNKMFTARSKWR